MGDAFWVADFISVGTAELATVFTASSLGIAGLALSEEPFAFAVTEPDFEIVCLSIGETGLTFEVVEGIAVLVFGVSASALGATFCASVLEAPTDSLGGPDLASCFSKVTPDFTSFCLGFGMAFDAE